VEAFQNIKSVMSDLVYDNFTLTDSTNFWLFAQLWIASLLLFVLLLRKYYKLARSFIAFFSKYFEFFFLVNDLSQNCANEINNKGKFTSIHSPHSELSY
jgi:hypothetical protein